MEWLDHRGLMGNHAAGDGDCPRRVGSEDNVDERLVQVWIEMTFCGEGSEEGVLGRHGSSSD